MSSDLGFPSVKQALSENSTYFLSNISNFEHERWPIPFTVV